ncbi:MAG: hypothetical protein HZA79_05905 [Sphingobacteriales bacterium]|nr:hypothetical protein [Sphingobacteriales bacterium]
MKLLQKILLILAIPLTWNLTGQYFVCPVFSFEEARPFQGRKIYNPYADADPACWKKCNFHAHGKAWTGLTNGKGTGTDIREIYDSLGYAVHLVSNYQSIDTTGSSGPDYIEAYEHGFNLQKTHELVLGAKKVEWLEYLLPQTASNKQRVINTLAADTNAFIIINHPSVRQGFGKNDLQLLSGYHGMEVLSPAGSSFEEWDAALSAGKPVFVIGNDDVHDIFKAGNIGKCCTWVNATVGRKKEILSGLKKGCSYGMRIPCVAGETLCRKAQRLKKELPALTALRVSGDSIRLALNKPADSIVFSGQNGRRLAVVPHTGNTGYLLKEEDSYIRTSVYFPGGIELYLNPVFRYDQDPFPPSLTSVNPGKTIFLTSLAYIVRLLTLLLVLRTLFYRQIRKWLPRFRLPGYRNPYPAS